MPGFDESRSSVWRSRTLSRFSRPQVFSRPSALTASTRVSARVERSEARCAVTTAKMAATMKAA
jgi:hypothetical protein